MAETSRDRLVRLMGIVTYLERNGATPFSVLGEHFGVSTAQITADVNLLWVSGLPGHSHMDLIDFNADLYASEIADLTESQGVAQVRFSPREAAALIGALSVLVKAGTAPHAAEEVLAKLSAAVGSTSVEVLGEDAVSGQVREALRNGVESRQAVRVDYVDAQDRHTTRVIEPHKLVAIDGVGYVECFCQRAQDYRVLRLDRIRDAEVLEVLVTHPPAEQGGFTLSPRFRATVTAHPGARWALEDLPHVDITIEADAMVASFDVADPKWTAGRLLAVAPSLTSVEPAELRSALAEQASAVAGAQDG